MKHIAVAPALIVAGTFWMIAQAPPRPESAGPYILNVLPVTR